MDWWSEFSEGFTEIERFEAGGLTLTHIILRLAIAMLLGMVLGIERQRREQRAGMRTYAVVSMASALIMIVSIFGLPIVDGRPQDPGRIAAQVVTGIGFLGAGVIFMRRNVVHGLTTAASLWGSSGVGLAVGGGLMITGTIATLFLLLISGGLHPVKQRFFQQEVEDHRVRLHLSNPESVIRDIRKMAAQSPGFSISSLDLESTVDKKRTVLEIRMRVENQDDAIDIVKNMEELPGVDRIGWHVSQLD